MDAIAYQLIPAFITFIIVLIALIGVAGEILHAEAAEEVVEAVEEAAEEVVEEATWATLELELKVADLEARVYQLEQLLLGQRARVSTNFEDVMVLVASDQGVVETIPEGVVTIELIQNARVVVRKSVKDFDLSHKEGRAGARQYLRDNGISIPSHTNRHQIRSKFRLVA